MLFAFKAISTLTPADKWHIHFTMLLHKITLCSTTNSSQFYYTSVNLLSVKLNTQKSPTASALYSICSNDKAKGGFYCERVTGHTMYLSLIDVSAHGSLSLWKHLQNQMSESFLVRWSDSALEGSNGAVSVTLSSGWQAAHLQLPSSLFCCISDRVLLPPKLWDLKKL